MSASRSDESMSRGAFIVLEGPDRCGKSTQTRLLQEHLQKHHGKVLLWNFPDRSSATGQVINQYLAKQMELSDAEVHELFSSNRREKMPALISLLLQGYTIVCDRYAYSGVAYTAAKQRPGLDIPACRAPDQGLPAPDVVLYLDLPQQAAAARAGYGEERYEKVEFQQQVIAKFAELNDGSSWYKDHWVQVDATGSIEQIHQKICSQVDAAMSACAAGAPIRQLWDYGSISQQLLQQAVEQHRQQQEQQQAAPAAGAGVADVAARENMRGKAAKAVAAVADASGQDVLKQRQ